MERLFATHTIRKSREALPVWQMTPLDGEQAGTWMKVIVPGIWESLPGMKNYRGRAVYEQQILCGGNLRFWFGGVSFRAKVYLDGRQLASHYGAYTGFEAIVKDIPYGTHRLAVEADNRFGEDSALHVPNDYYSYGGINRPVLIEEIGDALIEAIHVTPKRIGGVWHAGAEVRIRNLSQTDADYTLRLEIAGETMEKGITLPADSDMKFCLDMTCENALTWEPETPEMTPVTATLLREDHPVDDLIERIGFREVKVSGRQILLNGQPIRLKGFNRHEDFNDYGVSVPTEAMMRDLLLMRDIGANCVRTCHYPNDPRFLDLCDELGMLVWEESHARGLVEERMLNPRFMPQQELCTREMVDQHFNHPSIFIWGCLNECADNCEYGADCFRRILGLLHELDASRPMTAALLERMGSRIGHDTDVVSINIYPQWYHETKVSEAMARKAGETGAVDGKPLIVSEIGAGAIPGFHDPFGESKWSEERQSTILRTQIEAVLAQPDCVGVFLWQFADVRVDESLFNSRPRCFNNKGVVDEYRRPKLSYRTVKELFHTL